jgi:hypothetical protein
MTPTYVTHTTIIGARAYAEAGVRAYACAYAEVRYPETAE